MKVNWKTAAASTVLVSALSVTLAAAPAEAATRGADCGSSAHIDATYTISGSYSYLKKVHAYEINGTDKLSSTFLYYRADGGNTTFTSTSEAGTLDDDFNWSPNLGGVALSRKPYVKMLYKGLGGLSECTAYVHLY